METQEDVVMTGVLRPLKRMAVLLVVTYFAAVFSPLVEAMVNAMTPPRVYGNGMTVSGSSPLVNWGVFPAFEFFTMDVVPVFGPVTIFCILASVTDRSEAWRVNVFAGVVTFFAYVIEDMGEDALLMNLLLLVVVIAAVFWLWARTGVRNWWLER